MPSLIIKVKPRGTQKEPLVISISKKNRLKAVERNLLKRRVRALMRPFLKGSSVFYVIVKPGRTHGTYEELKEEIYSKLKEPSTA